MIDSGFDIGADACGIKSENGTNMDDEKKGNLQKEHSMKIQAR